MESIRSELDKVITEPFILRDYGNTVAIVKVLKYILDRLEEAEG